MWKKTLRTAAGSFALSLLCVGLTFAQEDVVRGTVTDGATGQPLPGANVTIQGTQTGTTTDVEGEYELEVPGPDAVLVFSFVGYQTQEVEVGDQTVIDVSLQEEVGQLDEVVVTGYDTQQRREITGAQSSVDVSEANVGQVSSPQDLLQGRAAGVSIISNSGEPGAGMRIRVRGTKSLSADSQPLIVLDGVPISNTNITPGGPQGTSNSSNPLETLNPQDIESIEVLKDAAATSIYGSQGSNGVILIETKSGAGGGLQVDYSGKASISMPAKKLDMLTAEEYRNARQEILGSSSEGGASTDWQEESMRSPASQEHNLSFSGGTEQTSYRASLNYLDQAGILLDSGFERLSGRINASHSALNNRVRLNLDLTSNFIDRNHAFRRETAGATPTSIRDMLAFAPTKPVRTEDGGYFEYSQQNRNPVGMLEQILDFTDQRRILGNFSVELDLLESLTAQGTLGIERGEGIRRAFIPKASAVGQQFGGIATQSERRISTLTTQSTFRYDRDLLGGAHSLRLLGGFEFERELFQTFGVETRDFITDAVTYNNLGSGKTMETPGSNKERVDQVGFFGRLNYNIQDKYLLTATVRRDGSSVFGQNNKFATFPSASVGWNLAEEPFLNVDGLTQLKLRGSYGLSGNQGVPPYESLPLLQPSRGFAGIFGADNEVTGVAQARTARPDLKWEETREFNVGVDFTYGRFSGTADYYRSETDDLLLNIRVLQPAPSAFVLDNVGAVSNEGVEASLEALVLDRENTSLTISANASSNRNEIDDLGNRGTIDHGTVGGRGLSGTTAQRLEAGHPIGSFYGPVFAGIDENGEETYRDGEGGTTTDAQNAPKSHIGNPIPDVAYSLNLRFQYHNFDASAFLRGEQGREILNNTALLFATKSRLAQDLNMLQQALNDGTGAGHQPTYSSRWVQDASFLRLDKLTVGYNLPNVSQYNLRRARIYLSTNNLFVFTPYSGYDPELNANVSGEGLGFRSLATPARGIDFSSYPRPRTFTLGIEFGF